MKKGFMLLETLVVSMFVMSVLIFLYMQFTTIYSNYERDVTYNSTNDMYALNTFRDYLLQDGLDEAKQALYNSESNYIWIYDEECGDYFSSTEYCNNLLGKLNLKKVLFTKENLKELNKELDNDIANKTLSDKFDRKLINYIKTISYIGEATTHRLIGEFNDGTYATINVLNASSNNIADYTVPVISGADDIEVPAWHAFDAEAGVTAIDDIDGDITGKIKIEGEVNPQIVGEYELTYTVEDSSGNVAIKKRKVTVVKAEYVDDSGAANPNLKGKLVPVTIEDNGTVKKADITTKWFDYDEKKWANAVILDDNIIPDVSGNKNHGYLQNGTTRNDGSVTTDGVDDYIYAGLMDHEFQNELSIVLRVKLNSKVNHDLFDNVELAGMSLFVRDDYKFAFQIYSNSKNAYYGIHANEVYELNKWYTIVGTFKDNKLHLYINGKEAATPVEFTGATDIKNSMTAFLIGSNPYGKNHCNSTNHTCGNMANLPLEFTDALIFDRALSTDEIASEFSGKITNVSNTSKMILRYELDDPIPNNTVLPEEVIESYFVWIPKYKYKLWNLGNYSNADGTATTGSASY